MSVLRSIESKLESLFEGVFGRAFRSNVQPVELARKLVKEMDDHRSVSVSRVYVPNEYTVYLSPNDRKQFDGYEDSLREELQDYLAEHARRERYVAPDARRSSGSRPTPISRSACSGSRPGSSRGPSEAVDGLPPSEPAGATIVYRPSEPPARSRRSSEPPVEPRSSRASSPCSRSRASSTSCRAHPVVLGRSKDCDIQLADPNVSRRHAEIRLEGDALHGRRPRLDERHRGGRASGSSELALEDGTASRSARPRSSSPGGATDHVPLGVGQVETTLLVLKIAFLVLLYLFIWRIVRSAARDLRLPQESMILSPAAGLGAPRAADSRASSAGSSSSTARRSRAGDVYAIDSTALSVGRGGDNDLAARRRRVRLGPPRPLRAAPRRRLRRGHRLDERHLRQRDPADARPPARPGRHRPDRRDRPAVRAMRIAQRSAASNTAASAGTTRTPTSASRRSSRSPTGWAARRPARSPPRSPPARCASSALDPAPRAPRSSVVALIQAANLRVHERATERRRGLGDGHDDDGRARRRRTAASRSATSATRAPTCCATGALEQLTDDHSLVAELVRRGELSPEEAEVHPQRSVITRALGTEPDVDVDAFTVEAQDGDLFLLCSDGLTTMVDADAIAEILERNRVDLDAATAR